MQKKPMDNKRSKEWPKVRRDFLKKHPICSVCNGKKKLEVHHKQPFHLHPDLELDQTNLITLCENEKFVNCHLFVGHLGNFKSWNINVVEDAKTWDGKMKNRPN